MRFGGIGGGGVMYGSPAGEWLPENFGKLGPGPKLFPRLDISVGPMFLGVFPAVMFLNSSSTFGVFALPGGSPSF